MQNNEQQTPPKSSLSLKPKSVNCAAKYYQIFTSYPMLAQVLAMVNLCVSVFVTSQYCGKTAEKIQLIFGI